MSTAIIVQPDGRLALWSTSMDAVTVWDATDDEIVDYLAEQAAQRARDSARRAIERGRVGDGPWGLPTWDEAVELTTSRYGADYFTGEGVKSCGGDVRAG